MNLSGRRKQICRRQLQLLWISILVKISKCHSLLLNFCNLFLLGWFISACIHVSWKQKLVNDCFTGLSAMEKQQAAARSYIFYWSSHLVDLLAWRFLWRFHNEKTSERIRYKGIIFRILSQIRLCLFQAVGLQENERRHAQYYIFNRYTCMNTHCTVLPCVYMSTRWFNEKYTKLYMSYISYSWSYHTETFQIFIEFN